MVEKVSILNVDILSIRKQKLLERLTEGVVFTPNVDHLVRLQKDRVFYRAYQQTDWVVCDSVILHRLSKLLRKPIIESIPGSSFFDEFCNFHRNDKDCRIFILGGKEGVAKQAQKNINARIGREIVVGAHSPSFQFVKDDGESREIVEMVRASGATVLIVCATSPKQEVWIARWRRALEGHTEFTESTERICSRRVDEGHTDSTDVTDFLAGAKSGVRLFMALGATVDFEAGTVGRCPLWLRRLGMEWFWRFCQEPRRLFRRYFIQDMQFFWYFGKQMMGMYRNPFT